MSERTPEDILRLLGKAKFRRVREDDYGPYPGIQSKKASIAYIGDDVTMIVDRSEFCGEWFLHVSFNDLMPERSFRLVEDKP